MAEIPAERKVAIAFIKAFRKHLDQFLKPSSSPSAFTEQQVHAAVKMLIGENETLPPDTDKRIRFIFQTISADFLKALNKNYQDCLPEIIIDAMSEIESYLKDNYTKQELDDLAAVSALPCVEKLFGDTMVFGPLRKQKNILFSKMEQAVLEYMSGPDMQKMFENAVRDLISKQDDDDYDDTDGHSLDPNDIF